jgi:hypothetical protein
MLCREHAAQLRRRKPELDAAGVEALFVAFSPAEAVKAFEEELIPGWTCLHDPDLQVYRQYALPRMPPSRVLSPKVIGSYLSLLLRGRRLRRPEGDPLQLGGDFLIDREGILRFVHRSRTPADRPDPDLLVTRAVKL